jgi:hypothetical protein
MFLLYILLNIEQGNANRLWCFDVAAEVLFDRTYSPTAFMPVRPIAVKTTRLLIR